jgi:hypothetical protein
MRQGLAAKQPRIRLVDIEMSWLLIIADHPRADRVLDLGA